jgi:hypothetical protein
LDTARAEFQIVTTHSHVVLDVTARNFGVDGREHREYCLAHLSLRDATRLQRLLSEAIAASQDVPDPRQTSMWGNSTAAAVGNEMRRGVLS